MSEPVKRTIKAAGMAGKAGPSRPPPPGVPRPATLWGRVKEHKVLQWGLGYLGAALALAHGQELLSHTFHWPELVGRIVVGALIVGFPIAIALAWYHGHRGLQRISAGELTIISILVFIGAWLLVLFTRSPSGHAAAVHTATTSEAVAASVARQSPRTTKPRVAILPFENLGPDPANAFFTDGLHEEILSTLARRAPGLEVISRSTMMMYRLKPKPLAEVARELRATHLIEGSVRREASQVRLTLQLIDARTDGHEWSQNYDRTLANALTLQSEVAGEVASQLSVQLAGGPQLAARPTKDPEAYDLYLKARLAAQLTSPYVPLARLRNVEDLLTRALARDPSFARAYVERLSVRMSLFDWNYETSEAHVRRAGEDLAAAKRLAPDGFCSASAVSTGVARGAARASTFRLASRTGYYCPRCQAMKEAHELPQDPDSATRGAKLDA